MIHKVITTQNKQSIVIDDLNLDELIVVKELEEVQETQETVSLVEDTILENCDVKVVDRRKK